MDRLLGNSLGRYRLETLLGEGGMGAVFKAYDVTLQRFVAVKIMHQQFTGVGNFRERFLQEARTAARLNHPSIVQVHDFGQEKELLYIVMEFIEGANLQQMLAHLRTENKWLPLTESVELLRQIALAVDYFHSEGVLHRDLKPANVMLKPVASEELPYRPVITDLGLAKLLEGESLTQEGTSMGTPSYMSPEQALGEKVDARSDVYSLGILLYELAVGQLPFPIKTLTEAIRYHTKEPPPPPRSLRPDLPVMLEKVILKALEKDPAQRIPNAGELAKGLRAITPQVNQAAASPTLLDSSISLVTEYQQSLLEPRGVSILQEFDAPADLSVDRIQVLSGNQVTSTLAFKSPSMVIGRDKNCDIVLDDQKASRNHARVEFDGAHYKITDLGSSNGTYFENVKILPGIPEAWTPEKPLRIGNTYLRLLRADAHASSSGQMAARLAARPAVQPDASTLDPARLHSSTTGGRTSLYLPETRYKVDAGGVVAIPVTLFNQGSVVDHFHLTVDGCPPSWLQGEPPVIQLMPGGQQQVSLTMQPPLSHRSRAGSYNLTLRAVSRDNPKDIAEAKCQLIVNPFTKFTSDFHPQRIRAGAAARLSIQNQGNQTETFNLTWRDRAEEVRFDPPSAQVAVQEGQSGFADFVARPRQQKWFGSEQAYPFTIQVQTAGSETQTHNGEVVARSRLPAWLIPALLSLCFLLGAIGIPTGYLVYQSIQKETQVQGTLLAEGTAVQHLSETAQASATIQAATAQAFATIQVATARAAGDDDQDGLSNIDEAAYFTLPDNPDTDGDGLSDGLEVHQYKTKPNLVDSDYDTLSDGQEVNELKTDPNNKDTDGDSLRDDEDPDPLHPSTLILATATLPPQVTPSPTTAAAQNLPGGQLAFVSDASGQSRVYVSGIHNEQLSISSPLPLPSGYNRALWPDWCNHNSSIAYEVAPSEDGSLNQAIYAVNPQGSSGNILIEIPAGYESLGVPRCPGDRDVLYYSIKNQGENVWYLWEYDFASRSSLQLTDGGNIDIFLSTYRSDWGVFMRRKPGGSYQLAYLDLRTSQVQDLSVPGFIQFGYPAVDPSSGRVIFACRQANWDLCLSDWAGSNAYQLLENITLTSTSQINPVWSPDGKWVAFSSNKLQEGQEDYDIWLFAPAVGKASLINLTSGLPDSDEIHPSWSKP